MNIARYFFQGFRNTLRLQNGVNFSYKGPWVQVEPNTVLDSWFVGEFMSADYTIVVDVSNTRKQLIKALAVAGSSEANVAIYGTSTLAENLIDITATVDDSQFKLIINPAESPDGSTYDNSTLLDNAKVIFSATYYQTVNDLSRT